MSTWKMSAWKGGRLEFVVRRLRWPEDIQSVNSIDASYSSESIYRVETTGLTFAISKVPARPPVHKKFDLSNLAVEIQKATRSVAVEIDGAIRGVATMEYESWNRRAILRHLYVSLHSRGMGVGIQLLNAMLEDVRDLNARCLWIETQNTNAPAIDFYLHCGFRLCGLDQTLYEPKPQDSDECALYFVRELAK